MGADAVLKQGVSGRTLTKAFHSAQYGNLFKEPFDSIHNSSPEDAKPDNAGNKCLQYYASSAWIKVGE